ncbi:MAG TPA: VPDSG-CTERM sorting domain-containing protein [Roseimicrobium sp.]|nr:VPDSG-CTERM sorting domain-containing protein [Roseimicrobium sp.]
MLPFRYLAVFALGLFCASPLRAIVIDFDTVAAGSVSTIGGATFSLAGVGESGNPISAIYSGKGYLWNSSDSIAYPTNSILRVDFASVATGVIFDFNNQGGKTTSWSLLDSSGATIVTGANIADANIHSYNLSAYTGVKSIVWNNNGNDWLFGLNKLTFESSASAVPDGGSTLLLLGLAVGGMVVAQRKLSNRATPQSV